MCAETYMLITSLEGLGAQEHIGNLIIRNANSFFKGGNFHVTRRRGVCWFLAPSFIDLLLAQQHILIIINDKEILQKWKGGVLQSGKMW